MSEYGDGRARTAWQRKECAAKPDDLLIRREAFENLMAWVNDAQHCRAILTDLIAELRELATCDIDLGNQTDPETLAFLLDRAEARLREVGDE